MASAAVDASTDRRIAPFATGPVVAVAVLVTVLHCATSTLGRGYWFDEVYVLAIGRYHLDWGSADQPPLAPALAALVDSVAPGFQLALALPASVATGFAVVLAALIARELGCDRRAQAFTAIAQATGLWVDVWLRQRTLTVS